MIQHLTRIALAGLLAMVTSFPGLTLPLDRKPTVIVMPVSGSPHEGSAADRTRHLIIDRLAGRGYVVLDGATPQKASAECGRVELRINAKPRRLTGSYTLRAVIGLSATLRDSATKRHLGRFEAPAGTPRRIATTCARACQDQLFFEQARSLVPGLVARIHRRLTRLTAGEITDPAEKKTHSLTLRGIEPGDLPQIEQYLSFFPGVSDVRRDRTKGETVLYRYRQSGLTHATEISLKKMLHHLQLNARLQRVGDSFVITNTPATRPVIHPRDW